MEEERKLEIEEAAKEYLEDKIYDDVCEECAARNGFKSGVKWSDSHPSLDLINKVVELAYSWDSVSPFEDLAISIKDKIQNGYTPERKEFYPFDIVIYKPTGERGLVKSVTENGVFVLFRIQSTANLCKFEDLEVE